MAKVVSIETVGEDDVFDIEVDEFHNYIANGMVVHNCMKIARMLAGFTMAEANRLRKGMGKKKKDVIAALKDKFMTGAQKAISEGRVTQAEVDTVFLKIASFAKYGFCKSHAVTYSALTCAELWLKYHYPVEYITALINNTHLGQKKFGEERLPSYINYARKRRFKVLGADINKSGEAFLIEDGNIRFSISHIKNVATATQVIIAGQPYKDIADFYERAAVDTVNAKGKKSKKRINKEVVDSLIYAGAFDCFGSREEVMKQYYDCRKNKKDKIEMPKTEKQWKDKEKEMTGMCLSVEPLRWKYDKQIEQNHWCTIDQLSERGRTKVFGRIASMLSKTSQKGNQMLVVTLTDDLDSMKFFVFGGAMVSFKEEYRTGDVAIIPMKKFDDGDTRFFDVDRDGQIVERKGV